MDKNKTSRLRLFLGKPEKLHSDIKLFSPTVDEIADIGEDFYHLYLIFSTFNRKKIFDYLKLINTINTDENLELELEQFDDYDILVSQSFLTDHISEALSFFIKDDVFFDYGNSSFMVGDVLFVNKDNYKEISSVIKELNNISDSSEEKVKFKNERAKKMYEKMQKLKAQHESQTALDLKDILSILCYAEDNGISIFNVGQLTIHQVYEQFERLSVREEHTRLLKVWANGLLKEGTKLKDWMIKTKL